MSTNTDEPRINTGEVVRAHYKLGEELLEIGSEAHSIIQSGVDKLIKGIKEARSGEQVSDDQFAMDLLDIVLKCNLNSPINLHIARATFDVLIQYLHGEALVPIIMHLKQQRFAGNSWFNDLRKELIQKAFPFPDLSEKQEP